MAAPKQAAPAQSQTLPLFYSKPTLLEAGAHGAMGLNTDMNFDFAKSATAIPVNMVEFPQIAHFYPIAFARDAVATPVAVVGVRNAENLYVQADGSWLPDMYVPAYVRRYPFILTENQDGTQLSLCIDDMPGNMIKNGGTPFFDDKKQPTQAAKNAIEFCRSYHGAARLTLDFGKALLEAGVLTDRSAELNLSNGQRISYAGFRIIDEEKFNKLPAKTLTEWRDKGWLAAAYAHLFSGLNWGRITRMANERIDAAAQKDTKKPKK